MSQSVVTIRLNGQPYQIGCGAGEEAHVEQLGVEVDKVMQDLVAAVGQIGEARLLAMVALILADRVSTTSATNAGQAQNTAADNADAEDRAAAAVKAAASQIAALASKLASAPVKP
jgi:cell division protein ZapA